MSPLVWYLISVLKDLNQAFRLLAVQTGIFLVPLPAPNYSSVCKSVCRWLYQLTSPLTDWDEHSLEPRCTPSVASSATQPVPSSLVCQSGPLTCPEAELFQKVCSVKVDGKAQFFFFLKRIEWIDKHSFNDIKQTNKYIASPFYMNSGCWLELENVSLVLSSRPLLSSLQYISTVDLQFPFETSQKKEKKTCSNESCHVFLPTTRQSMQQHYLNITFHSEGLVFKVKFILLLLQANDCTLHALWWKNIG